MNQIYVSQCYQTQVCLKVDQALIFEPSLILLFMCHRQCTSTECSPEEKELLGRF